MSFVTKPFPANPDFKVDDKVFRCEATSDRWLIDGDDDSYYYDLRNEKDQSNIEKAVDLNNTNGRL